MNYADFFKQRIEEIDLKIQGVLNDPRYRNGSGELNKSAKSLIQTFEINKATNQSLYEDEGGQN